MRTPFFSLEVWIQSTDQTSRDYRRTLLDAEFGKREIRHARTGEVMKSLSDRDLNDYLTTGAWQRKAGAYGLQDYGDAFVERIEGSVTNVVGIPMEPHTTCQN